MYKEDELYLYKEKYKLCEGKTKIIWQDPNDDGQVLVQNKPVITAGNGKKRDFLENKDVYSTETACNVFELLQVKGVSTHYLKPYNRRVFLARRVNMIPMEIVVRRIAFGSYCKRHPDIPEGVLLSPRVTEFFLKDDGNNDPFMIWDDSDRKFMLCNSKEPLEGGLTKPFDPLSVVNGSLLPKNSLEIQNIRQLAMEVFWKLEKAWADFKVTLVDLKIEMGFDAETKKLLVADAIDNDSWRIWPLGDKSQMKDKQVYRDLKEITPEALEKIRENYGWVVSMTRRFSDSQYSKLFFDFR